MTEISIAARRARLLEQIFPDGVPGLWCPSLTHYDSHGAIDRARIAAHLRHLAPHVKGFLVPGSTGDGWVLSKIETRQLLEIALEEARGLSLHLLIGLLKPTTAETLEALRDTVEGIKSRSGEDDSGKSLALERVCGFAICAPRGAEMSQEDIANSLRAVLERGLPTALYQLPQVTQNEIGAELVSKLAAEFENFLLFKDSSGTDRVALSGQGLSGVFTMRGAEGNYSRWLKSTGGPYDGFLLSTANCFAAELGQVMNNLRTGKLDAARDMSERLTAVINEVFRLVAALPEGNPFTNANKAMDHFFAFGSQAAKVSAPRLHGGSQLPMEAVREAGAVLERYGLMPRKGYLE